MPPDHLTDTFNALADPTRRRILFRLSTGEKTVTELAKPFENGKQYLTRLAEYVKTL